MKDTSGPAFPAWKDEEIGDMGHKTRMWFLGMSLRDYFAAQSLPGVIQHPDMTNGSPEQIAGSAYLIADAMLKAREAA